MADPINTTTMPGDNMNPDNIEAAAGQIRTVGTNVAATGGDVAQAWSGLKKGYQAPEQDTLFGAIQPARQAATDFSTDMGKVAAALETFAGEVRTIKANVAKIRSDANAFLAGIHDGKVTVTEHRVSSRAQLEMGQSTTTHKDVDWDSDQASVDANNALIRRTNDQQEQLWAAERKCANAINDVYGGAHIAAASESNPNGYGVTDIPDNADTPWGHTVQRKESCGDKVVKGVFVDGLGGMAEGITSLVGFSWSGPGGAGFSWSTAGHAWNGLAHLATGGPMFYPLALLPGPVGNYIRTSIKTNIDFVPNMVGIDVFAKDPFAKWKGDPARTFGSSLFNVGSLFIPVGGEVSAGGKVAAGGAKVADGTGDLAKASRGAEGLDGLGNVAKAADAGGDLTKIGGTAAKTDLGNLGKVTDDLGNGIKGLDKIDVDVPNIPHDHINTDHPNIGDHTPQDPPPARDPGTIEHPQGDPHQVQPHSGAPDGTQPSAGHPGKPYDPDAPVPHTEPAKDAPSHYTPQDVQHALDNAPVNEHGQPVDHRTGEPLVLHRADGTRGWEMRWDPQHHDWVAQNLGSGYATGLPAHGAPGSFAYNDLGNRMPYANHRPSYAPGQVEAVWRAADRDGDGIVTVRGHDGRPVEISWDGKSSREGLWDMGHVPGGEYAELRHQYLSHEISYDEFIRRYQDPNNYEVQDPSRNRAHLDEVH